MINSQSSPKNFIELHPNYISNTTSRFNNDKYKIISKLFRIYKEKIREVRQAIDTVMWKFFPRLYYAFYGQIVANRVLSIKSLMPKFLGTVAKGESFINDGCCAKAENCVIECREILTNIAKDQQKIDDIYSSIPPRRESSCYNYFGWRKKGNYTPGREPIIHHMGFDLLTANVLDARFDGRTECNRLNRLAKRVATFPTQYSPTSREHVIKGYAKTQRKDNEK